MKSENNKITSVSQFVERVNEINKLKQREIIDENLKYDKDADEARKCTFFYRGHSNMNYILEPGIYRKIKNNHGKKMYSLIEYEHIIYKEIISKSPFEFKNKNALETLALMQHYGAPTRVLDITENPLVALFFSLDKIDSNGNEINEDGEVIALRVPNKNVCFYDSDKVVVLSNLVKLDEKFKYFDYEIKELKDILIEYKAAFSEIEPRLTTDISQVSLIKNYLICKSGEIEVLFVQNIGKEKEMYFSICDKLMKNFKENHKLKNEYQFIYFYHSLVLEHYRELYQEKIQEFNSKYLGKLLHCIKEDKQYFNPIIAPFHLDNVYAVKPKLDNPRILKQSGAFLIFGIQPCYKSEYNVAYECKKMSNLNKDWISSMDNRIIIDAKYKDEIKKELDFLGINQATLFPEIDKISTFIKGKFESNVKNRLL